MEDLIMQFFGDYAPLVLSVMGVCAAVAALLPAPGEKTGKVYRAAYAALNLLAVNVGKARNADDAEALEARRAEQAGKRA